MLAFFGLGAATLLGVTGLFISFVPGADALWFGLASALAVLGLLVPRWKVRLFSVVLIVVCACFAWSGYEHGVQSYQEWLQESGSL